MKQTAITLGAVILCALALAVPGAGQSAFPVRLDAPEPESPATLLSTGAFTVQTGTDYQTQGTLTVTPSVAENLFRITATQDDTTVWVQVLVAAVQSDTTTPGSAYEKYLWAIFDSTAGTWATVQSGAYINLVGGGQIGIDYTLAGNQITVKLTNPVNLDQATFRILAIANKTVTFTPLI